MATPRDPLDPWRLPSVDRFGDQLRERARAEQEAPHRAPSRRLVVAASVATVAVALIVVILLERSRPAEALSPVNRAPAVAVASRSVAFHSTTTASLAGRLLGSFTEHGVIDFAGGRYQTVVGVPSAGVSVEDRRINGALYTRESHRRGAKVTVTPWRAARLAGGARVALLASPESATVTEPVGLLRILQKTGSKVTRLGPAVVDGVSVVRYSFSSNLASVVEAASGSPAPNDYDAVHAQVRVALDTRGRPVLVSESFSGRTTRGIAKLNSTTHFSSYGHTLRVAAPVGVSVGASHAGNQPSTAVADPLRLFEAPLFSAG